MNVAELYRSAGLGAVIREMWRADRPDPPQASTAEVWLWVPRADMATSLALVLVEDPRLLFAAVGAQIQRATRFRGGRCHAFVRMAVEALHSQYLTPDREIELREGQKAFHEEYLGFLSHVLHMPRAQIAATPILDIPTMWEPLAFTAAHNFVGAAGLLNHGQHLAVVRARLEQAAGLALLALVRKLADVDHLPPGEAMRLANEEMLTALRSVVTPEMFGVQILRGSIATQN